MEPNSATTTTPPDCISKKLMHIFRVVYYMLRKSISKRKLMMDLNSLLKQSKLAGKALTKLLTHHHHHHHNHSTHSHHHHHSSFSCRSMDPAASFYNPQEVEFSYTPTPQLLPKLRSKNHRNKKHYDVYNYETAAAIAKAFEMLNNNNSNSNSSSYNINDPQASDDDDHSVLPSPSPLMFGIGKSPIMVRQLRITDSPFPIEEDDKVCDGKVDKEADDFIRRFYEQLKMQKGTPEYNFRRG